MDAAHAQPPDAPYPNKPLRLVVPVPPGGAVDPIARMVALRLGPRLKQQVKNDSGNHIEKIGGDTGRADTG
jgi:tripartite-type tricarboxylate transporter receptor subunit TctC